MEAAEFNKVVAAHQAEIDRIRQLAHKAHADVNQHYDKVLPYSVHIDSVADNAMRYAHIVCQRPDDVLPIAFGAYFHDTIEDARLTYNNVMNIARTLMSDAQALMATEIVYALTNEKGRTRAERANDRYYQGIRCTPYAPLCKAADRIANMRYSAEHADGQNNDMALRYSAENPHFVESLTTGVDTTDPRLRIPQQMLDELMGLVNTAN